MIRLVLMMVLLFSAGMMHLLDPFSFVNAIPSFVPLKLEVIFWTGILEFSLAAGLIFRKTRPTCAQIIAGYFILLIPIHIYVSWNSIPILGIKDPVILWVRTLFQGVLIWWALSLRKVGMPHR